MAETILYGIAQQVLKNLRSAALNEIASAWGFKTQLQKLENTINTLKDVLLDAEEKQADNHAVRRWLERLSTVVYAADDLFDEFNVVAARKQLMGGHKLTKEVCTFFSHSNQVALACKISWNIKKIREELDDIVKDGTQFEFVCGFPERGSAMSRRRNQTMSFVDAEEIVGREDDKKAILEMLLKSSSTGHENGHDEGLPVISIVGLGGMGKTALAKLIYNDPQVKEYFHLRLWVCVPDDFDIKIIIKDLLKSATNNETPNLEMDQLQSLWRKEVANKKYLLVLDDVWNEDREQWLKLEEWIKHIELFKIGRRKSKILVTTRSKRVARIMGDFYTYNLEGLSKENSWKLFEKMAFNPGEAQQKPHLVKIGEKIVKKCWGVPLAIRTLGSLLYGQEEQKWSFVKDESLAKIDGNSYIIMGIIKLSYQQLWSPLKNCFAYCALFPKNYEFEKDMLIDLWIAEGFIVPPSNDDTSLDEVAEEYFHLLLHRGFFQDIKRNSLEVIESCKIHDLMHDLAHEVAGCKCMLADDARNVYEKSVHLSLAYPLTPSREIPNSVLNMKLLHTFLLREQIRDGSPFSKSISQEIVTRLRCLRVLDLNKLGLKSLPSSIGKLIHLRYLNLSYTPIEKLSDSITDIWNLQTLKLCSCMNLTVLPANMRKLINLRSLDVTGCTHLSHLPSGLGGLTSLNTLPVFIVKREQDAANSRYKPTPTAKLSDLKNLNKLRGTLKIDIKGNLGKSMLEARESELSNKHGLTELWISFPHGAADCNHDKAVLEGLEPPPEIKRLRIDYYRDRNVPSWARMDDLCTSFPNLVEISLDGWHSCQQLPAFSKLRFLKRLQLRYMERVEYIENDDVCGVPSSSRPAAIFFPSLEELDLFRMKNLKGWWKQVEETEYGNETSESASNELAAQQIPTTFRQFPRLVKLSIMDCPKLRLLPLCPNVEDLTMRRTNETLPVLKMAMTSSSSSTPSSSSTRSGLRLEKLSIDNAEYLTSLSNHCLHQLSSLEIYWDNKLESTDTLEDVFVALSSLRSLRFGKCHKLRRIAKGMEHLTELQSLELDFCVELDVSGDEEGMLWKALNTSLSSLTLSRLRKLVGLPTGLQHLSNLCSLYLIGNRELEELPEWISCLSSLLYLQLRECTKLRGLPEAFRQLTSLNYLEIIACPGLKARCQNPDGSEWPQIQHIPLLSVRDKF